LKTLSAIGLITIDIQIALHRKGINDWMNANIPGRKAEQAWLEKHVPGYKAITDFFGTSLPDGGSAPTTQSVTKAGVMTAAAPFAGVPYQWGGGHGAVPGPSFASGHGRSGIGLDCSGYARAVLANMGIAVNGSADSLLSAAKSHPAVAALRPGDLVFYEGTHPNHVMVYIGNGQVIGETHTGASGPEVKPVGYMKITGTGRYVATENASTVPAGGMPGTTPTPSAAPTKSTSALDAIVAGGTSKAKGKKGHVLSGMGLLSGAVRTGLARAEGTPGDADDLRELERARAELEKKLRDAHGKQRVAIEEELGKTNKAIDVIEKRHADARARADKAAYAARVSAFKAHLDALKRAADEKRQAFETAFGLLAQKELAGFDRQTSLGVASLDAERATLTESEQKIKDIEDAKARAQRDAAVAAAQSDLAKAIADGDPDAVKTAQQALSDAQLDVQLAALQEQAATERAARDKLYADKVQAYQDDRDLQRDQLQAWLDEQQAKLETGATQWATFWAEIKDQAAAAGIDTSSAFWKSFEAAGGMASGALSASRAADVATSVVPGGARVGTSYGKNSYVVGGVLVTPGFARGVRGFGGGLALVGEEGPELVNLPGGSDVISNVGAAGVVEQHTHVYLDGEEIFHSVQRAGNRYNKRNGRGGSGV
jgi:cell wall-associated NlpC family hydrolase